MPQLAAVGRLMNPGGRGAWNPLRLGSSLLAWWSADRPDLMTLSGSQVTTWRDIVAGYAPTQGVSGSRPIYSATSFNGAAGVTFDGVDDYLELASQPFPSGAVPSEIWALVDQTSLVADTTARIMIGYGGNSGNTARLLYRSVVSAQNRVTVQTGLGGSVVNQNLAADFSGRHVGRAIFTATTISVALDGTVSSTQAAISNTSTTLMRLGNGTSASSNYFKGVMRDAIITGPLSAAQAALLEAYLDNRRMP